MAHQQQSAVEVLVGNGQRALREYTGFTQERVDRIVRKAALAALAAHTRLAKLAVEETGLGVFEDKAVRNVLACEHAAHALAGLRTVGVVRRDAIDGTVEIAEPLGVVAAVTPVTSPTSTVVLEALIALKTRNPVVFAGHPSARRSSAEAARVVRDAAVAAGAPAHCIQWIDPPSAEATGALMNHEGVAVVLATGDEATVRAAYSCGKPAFGVSPGPGLAYVEKSADLAYAVHDIVLSRSFDNGMSLSSEQTVILDREIHEPALAEFRKLKAYLASPAEKPLLERYLLDGAAVGRSPVVIAEAAGFAIPTDTSLILVEADEPLTGGTLCPVLAVHRAESRAHGLRLVAQLAESGGRGRVASVHTGDESFAEEFGHAVKARRVVRNAPASQGGMGDLCNASDLLRIKRIEPRATAVQWFRVPPKILFERNCLSSLADMPGMCRIVVVTDRIAVETGHLERLRGVLQLRAEPVEVRVIDQVEPEPAVDTVEKGAELMRGFRPDTIIALGGGAPIDAAKVMWLMYEHPEVELADLKEKFFDLRSRGSGFPDLGEKARLVCVPTTSGTGSEVSPFAVVTDAESGRRYRLADHALTPSVAIVDPALTDGASRAVTADAGFDALTHCVEAYVSVYANDFTDGLALQGIKLVFENLEKAVTGSSPTARERTHHAGAIAGMAFGSAFLGVIHAMAYTLGTTFHVAHGRCNALLLPQVIRYNGARPARVTNWPRYRGYVAPERFQGIARMLGLEAATPEQGVESLARAVEELRDRVGIPRTFKEAGVDETAFLEALPQQAMNAYEDQCAPANPRLPMIADLEQLMRAAYYGV